MQDAQQRLSQWSPGGEVPLVRDLDQVLDWVRAHALNQVQLSTPPVAQAGTWLARLSQALREHQVRLELCTRDWDEQSYRHAERGYFRFRKKSGPALLALAQGAPSQRAPCVPQAPGLGNESQPDGVHKEV